MGFSAFMRRINWRICAFTCGRPFRPALPQPAEGNPEQPIEAIQFGPGLLPLEDGELLAKSDGFQGEFVMWQKKGAQVNAQARVTMVRS